MKLSEQTREILSHFSTVGENFVFKIGQKQAMISGNKTRMVEAEIVESIPCEIGLYDFKKFVGCLKSFDEPEIKFEKNYASVSEGGVEAKFCISSLEVLTYPKTELKFDPNGLHFKLSEETIKRILKFIRLMAYEYVSIEANGTNAFLKVQSGPTSDKDELEIDLGLCSEKFAVLLKVKDLTLMSDDYVIHLSDQKIVKLKAQKRALTYYIAAERVNFDSSEPKEVTE